MPNYGQDTRRRNIELVYQVVKRNEGVSEKEIADELNMNPRTVNNYLRVLEYEGKIEKETHSTLWHALPFRSIKLRPIELEPEEAVTLYLAARLLVKQQDKKNASAQLALTRLAEALSAAGVVENDIYQAALELSQRTGDESHSHIFRIMVQSYIHRRKVQITYAPLNGPTFETIFSPYLIEPSATGFATYIIGHSQSQYVDDVRTYKIQRILEAKPLNEEYLIPSDFGGLKILRTAWTIIHGDKEIQVKLRFSPRVAQRVKESHWHQMQGPVVDDPEKPGWVIWTSKVADLTDLKPWVRSWGKDCEALQPEGLRKSLEREARQLAALYGVRVGNTTEDNLIAHRRKKDGEEQPLITHLTEASKLAEQFASKIGLPEVGKIIGLLHDFGKASVLFQGYLRSKEGLISPDEDGYVDAKRGEVDHSTAGAQLVYQKLAGRGREGQFIGQFLALVIASHHSGLIDCLKPDGFNEFERRINKHPDLTHLTKARSKLPDIENQLDEILAQPIEKRFYQAVFENVKEAGDSSETLSFKRGLLARFLLSCLLDADRLNTADFEWPGNESIRNYGEYITWETLIERLEAKFRDFAQDTAQMPPGRALEVNKLRAQVAQACLDMASRSKGIYQLTVPTGGGKTLASLRFALHHAQTHKMDRVFYIVPYITIIDQNANTVREILEMPHERDKVVLEHHSNLTPEKETRRHNLLAENWDAPIVFTTQVQFLEALFGYGTRDARRMHQLANSVIIFDEVQTIPIKITHMFTTALRFLTHDCGATVVLCTATQPPLDKLPNEYRKLTIKPEHKIIQNEEELFEKLKRVEVHDERKPGGMTNIEIADLAERALQEKGSVLIVVNTRRMAQTLYKEIKGRKLATTYHLSTNMCPAHRLEKLEEIKAKLKAKKEAKEPVICVSTQLVEAGVDVDFGAVIRSLAGLDSIAQAAGRCNRHGEREGLGSVWVVNPQEENLARLPDIKTGGEKAQTVLDNFNVDSIPYGNDRIGLSAIAEYYRYYYIIRANEMDYPVSKTSKIDRDGKLYDLLSRNTQSVEAYRRINKATPNIPLRQSFQSAGRAFHVIDSVTQGVVVPYGEGKAVIADLCSAPELEKQYKLLKKAQRYSVNLYDHQFKKLSKTGAIQEVQQGTGIYYLDERYYDAEFGWSDEPVNLMSFSTV